MVDVRPAPATHTFDDLDIAAQTFADSALTASPAEFVRSKEEFTRSCLPFAGRMARRYGGRGEAADDLEQVARLGLVKAVDRYDPARGSFTAYAVITISGEIKRHFRDKTWGVHVPRRLQDLGLEVGQATAVLTTRLARQPTRAEIAAQVGASEADVRAAQESAAGYTPTSLSTPVAGGDGTTELGDLFGSIDTDLDLVDDRVALGRLLARLPARERRLLTLRFHGNRTQAEIAAEMGVSQMHVSRLLGRTLAWLRDGMLGDALPSWEGSGGLDHEDVSTTMECGPRGVVVRIRGEADRDTAGRLRQVLRQAVHTAAPRPVRIDLAAVPVVDAAAVAVLVDAASAAAVAGVRLRLTGARPLVKQVLAACSLAALTA